MKVLTRIISGQGAVVIVGTPLGAVLVAHPVPPEFWKSQLPKAQL